MLNFITQNLGTIIIGAVVLGLIVLAVAHLIKDKKKGVCSSCSGCNGCPHSNKCHK